MFRYMTGKVVQAAPFFISAGVGAGFGEAIIPEFEPTEWGNNAVGAAISSGLMARQAVIFHQNYNNIDKMVDLAGVGLSSLVYGGATALATSTAEDMTGGDIAIMGIAGTVLGGVGSFTLNLMYEGGRDFARKRD